MKRKRELGPEWVVYIVRNRHTGQWRVDITKDLTARLKQYGTYINYRADLMYAETVADCETALKREDLLRHTIHREAVRERLLKKYRATAASDNLGA